MTKKNPLEIAKEILEKDLAIAADTNDRSVYGPPDKHGRRVSHDGSQTYYPGEMNMQHFTNNAGVKMIRLGDGREFPEADFYDRVFSGEIQCGIHPLNLLF